MREGDREEVTNVESLYRLLLLLYATYMPPKVDVNKHYDTSVLSGVLDWQNAAEMVYRRQYRVIAQTPEVQLAGQLAGGAVNQVDPRRLLSGTPAAADASVSHLLRETIRRGHP